MAKKTQRSQPRPTRPVEEISWPFGMKNYLLFAISMVVIVVGYITLGNGSMTLAPILLVLGYCVLIPAAILIKDKPEKSPAGTPDMNTE